MSSYDAVIVGARCAGATLGLELARAGWRVLMVERDELGSDTLSTHALFPNSIARLEELGVMARLQDAHEVPHLMYRLAILGREIAGPFTPIAGFDRLIAPRRVVLDRAIVETAIEAGAEARFGARVTGLIGSGRDDDPVRGVMLADGDRIEAPWVLGADGRASLVANRLGLERVERMSGEFSMLLAYWTGLPPTEYMHLDAREDLVFNWIPCEDGISLLVVSGPAEFTRGGGEVRERRYQEGIRSFPETVDPAWLEGAERITEIRVAPETMMRGFYRRAHGPGWALIGDAGHFKHPATAQGISDAIEQAVHVARSLTDGDRDLEGYEEWRDARAAGHYEWSFQFATFPRPEVTGPIFEGMSRDEEAAQDFRDVLSRRLRPAEALTPERLERWFAAAAVA
jgi:2-polyprenyl-6-methoxyphenol hydroxylase-like FAD-dependent oxidoreductase